jgi:hypothetical protein
MNDDTQKRSSMPLSVVSGLAGSRFGESAI